MSAPRPISPPWDHALALFRADQHAAGVRSADDYARRVARLARAVTPRGPWDLTHGEVAAWLEGLHGSDRRAYAAALRRFYEWAVTERRTTTNPVPPRAKRPGPPPATRPPEWEAWLHDWRTHLRADGRPETTIRLRTTHLNVLARQLGTASPADVTAEQLVTWFAVCGLEPESRRSYRTSARTFYEWALADGRASHNPAAALPKMRGAAPNPRPAATRAYADALALAQPREALMLRLAAELGLRRGEVARAHSRDLLQDDDGWSLLVHGKGGRERVVPLPDGLAAALRAQPPGWAFPSPTGAHLTADHIGHRINALLPTGVTMHALRHRFATLAYEVEHDVFAVQQLLGHSSPATTRRYVKVQRATLRSTVARVAPCGSTREHGLPPASTEQAS